jgi:Protein of unknown function (DUF2950)/Protein of unknown function (DUF3300)
LLLSLLLGTPSFGTAAATQQTPRPPGATSVQQGMDTLLAPIALYRDALLAQALAGASSPQQVTEVNKWLRQNSQLQGTDLQQSAEYGKGGVMTFLINQDGNLYEKDLGREASKLAAKITQFDPDHSWRQNVEVGDESERTLRDEGAR